MPLTAPLVILGQLTSASFAAGLNLYLTVALIGISSRLGWIPTLPPELSGLENAVLLATAIILYIVEFVVDKIPHVDSVWDALHTVIRPVGAGLLAFLALDTAPLHFQMAAAVFAALVALAAHGSKAGLRLRLNTSPSRVRTTVISTLEDVCAAALAVVALRYPVAALGVGAASLALVALLGPGSWRALFLAVSAFTARIRAFFGSAGWHPMTELPQQLQDLVEPLPLGRGEPRAFRAALKGVPGVGAYRCGWLVLSYDRACFLYQSVFGGRSLPLPRLEHPQVRHGVWTDSVEFQVGKRRGTLFLLKDGPTAEVAVADLARVS